MRCSLFAGLLGLLALHAQVPPSAPFIASLSPATATVGEIVTISGERFGAYAANSVLRIGSCPSAPVHGELQKWVQSGV
jgi:hypothetical protein